VAWLGGWSCILALSAWSAQLSTPWLVLAGAAALLWSFGVRRTGTRGTLAATALLWACVGLGVGVESRLLEVIRGRPAVERRVEDRAADALGASLDALVDRGADAVAGVEEAVTRPGAEPPERRFRRLEAVRREAGVSAVAVFDVRGDPMAWAGEHRGSVPLSVRRGAARYSFHGGPLFSYVYFTRRLPDGGTAVAAVLLEADLPSGPQVHSFASEFRDRHGVTPVFTLPERARGRAIWDWSVDRPILSVSFAALTQQAWWERVVERGRVAMGLLLLTSLGVLAGEWYRRRMPAPGLPVALATAAAVVAPLGAVTGSAELFSPVRFVLPLPVDVSLGMLLLLLLGGAVWLVTRIGGGAGRWHRLPPWAQGLAAALVIPIALEVVRRSATGALLAERVGGGFALELAATLLLALPLFLLLRSGHHHPGGRRSGWLAAGLALAAVLALARVVAWSPDRTLPPWAAAAWAAPFVLLARSLPPRARTALPAWLLAGGFAALVALPELWTMHERAKLASAEREILRLGTQTDPYLDFLLRQFARSVRYEAEGGDEGVDLLYHGWVASGLAREGFEARLTIWRDGQPEAGLSLTESDTVPDQVPAEVARARGLQLPVVEQFTRVPGLHYLLLAPLPGDRIVSVAVPPRRRLGEASALARFLDPNAGSTLRSAVAALHLLPVADAARDSLSTGAGAGAVRWVPSEEGWRSEARARFPDGWMHVHLLVRSASLSMLLVRGLLVATALLALLLAIWALGRLVCGEVPDLHRGWLRSFRGRTTLALFGFFLIPTAIFGLVSYGAVSREVFHSAAALAQRALEQAVRDMDGTAPLARVGEHVGTDLLLYRNGSLSNAAAPEMLDLGIFDAWLPPEIQLAFARGEDVEAVDTRNLGASDYLVAYRRLSDASVLAAPIPLASEEIARRQTEFRDIALLLSLVGGALSVVLALLVGRELSHPIDELSRAAAAVGSGNLRLRLPEERPDEFGGVYRSFNRMVRRLQRARGALVRETRRTEAIVSEAATGVMALDAAGRVELVNPRAAEILGVPIGRGEPLPREGALVVAVAEAVDSFSRSGALEVSRELEVDGRILRLRLRRLTPADGPGGAVLALEDVTAEVRTARVLAWGEMARQVAHEIKNPLTPIKLSVQHLRRAFQDRRPDYEEILDRNVDSILREIDRLGEIARAFARFGTPQPAGERLESVDVSRAVEETLALYRGAGHGIEYRVDYDGARGLHATARMGELKEVLVNLLENARDALRGEGEVRVSVASVERGRRLEIVVADDGEGVPPGQMPRIFDPHFSTRTSGTGLGLAIVRRLVESWGGEISADSEPGRGTRMRLVLRAAEPDAP
jgi:signal transduction histidine kinase